MKPLDLILEEKKQRLQEMYEYNKRLDRTVILYITAIYAAIGLRVTGKIELTAFSTDPEFTMIAFLFIFLNFCILLHGISQSAWTMALSKFVHTALNEDIRNQSGDEQEEIPESVTIWDNWSDHMKALAVKSRTYVMFTWVFLVFIVSIYSLSVVDVTKFYSNHPLITIASSIFLFLFQTLVLYLGLLELHLSKRFHEKSQNIIPPRAKFTFFSFLLSVSILLVCLLTIIK